MKREFKIPFHFSDSEYVSRFDKTKEALAKRSSDALLMFAPESNYLIYGYDTFGFAMFQCVIVGADGQLNLLTSAADLRQAHQTWTLDDCQINVWRDVKGVTLAKNLVSLAFGLGYRGKIRMKTQIMGLTF